MPNTPNSHPRSVFQKLCPGTSTSAMRNSPRHASTTLRVRFCCCARRCSRRETFLRFLAPDPEVRFWEEDVLRVLLLFFAVEERYVDFPDFPVLPERDCAMIVTSPISFPIQNCDTIYVTGAENPL